MARYSHGELVQLEQAGKNAERCVCCGAVIPEGRQVCPDCEKMEQKAEARIRRTEHHIKIQQEFADAIISGEKTFEIRINDRGYQKGDLIRFQVVDGYISNTFHPLNDKVFEITYVLSGWGLSEGYVAFAIKEKTDEH